jgi:hypothetical protein
MDDLEAIKTAITAVTAFGALVGGAIALLNARNSIRWKRAELASGHLQELTSNDELVFACRALDWNGGLLVVPERLRPLLQTNDGRQVIVHEPAVLEKAMRPDLLITEMQQDARLQLYRTAMDSLLSWLSLVRKALDRDLFEPADIEPVAYWLDRIVTAGFLGDFIRIFGYQRDIEDLRKAFHGLRN